MLFWIGGLAGLVLSYLIGATPTGYLAGKLLKGVDLRQHGSRSTGATNVLRTLGKGPALAVLLIDLLKGAAAVLFALWCFPWLIHVSERSVLDPKTWAPWGACLAGLAVLLGHARSIWLNFTGGKSAATGLGVLLALAWPVGVGAAAAFGAALLVSRIVSLSSMIGAVAAVVLVVGLEQPAAYRLLVAAGGVYVILRHRANIQRLLDRTEPRLGRSAAD